MPLPALSGLPNAEIAWNEVVSDPRLSTVSVVASSGRDGLNPAAPYSGSGSDFVEAYSNTGIALGNGHDAFIHDNTVLGLVPGSGIALRHRCQADANQPGTNTVSGNTIGWGGPRPATRGTARSHLWHGTPHAGVASGNTMVPTTPEQDRPFDPTPTGKTVAARRATVRADGFVIGPR